MDNTELEKLIITKAKECRFNNNTFSKAASEIKMMYPSLNLTINALRKRIRRRMLKTNKMVTSGKDEQITRDENKETGVLDCRYVGKKQITSEEEAIEFFKIDTDRWEPDRLITNSWDVSAKDQNGDFVTTTNYQVKITFKRKEKNKSKAAVKKYFDSLVKVYGTYKPKPIVTGTSNVVCLADLHFGAKTDKSKGILRTPDVNIELLTNRLYQVSNYVNTKKGPVTLCLLGDLIESFTGLNHLNTWAELESWGSSSVIGTANLLETFFRSIDNLTEVRIISGNHDRISVGREHDQWGQAAEIISHILNKTGFNVIYHPLIQKVIVDGICYLIIHGDKLKATKPESIFFEYGEQGKYNVLVSAHTHNRTVKRTFQSVEIKDMHKLDAVDYRSVTVAPIFTGNFWSESKGFTSSAGFSIFKANEFKNNIYHEDVPL